MNPFVATVAQNANNERTLIQIQWGLMVGDQPAAGQNKWWKI